MTPGQPRLINPVLNGTLRKTDKWGSGHYGASRGTRKHIGADIVTQLGKHVLSPIEGKVLRLSYPYANDLSYTGLLIEGTGPHKGFEVKIFYMKPIPNVIGKSVKPGEKIGSAQSLLNKYPGITNHIHLEIKHNGIHKDPKTLINNLF